MEEALRYPFSSSAPSPQIGPTRRKSQVKTEPLSQSELELRVMKQHILPSPLTGNVIPGNRHWKFEPVFILNHSVLNSLWRTRRHLPWTPGGLMSSKFSTYSWNKDPWSAIITHPRSLIQTSPRCWLSITYVLAVLWLTWHIGNAFKV